MDSAIITSCISVIGALLVCLINNYYSSKKAVDDALNKRVLAEKEEQKRLQEEQRKRDEGFVKAIDNQHMEIMMLSNKVDALSAHVEKHNSVVERTFNLEKMAVQLGEIQNRLEQRMDDLRLDTLRRLEILESDGK